MVIISVTVATIADMSQTYAKTAYAYRENLSEGSAVFDLVNQIEKNTSVRECIISGNSTCVANLSKVYKEIFGVNVEISANGNAYKNLHTQIACFYLENKTVCIGA